MEHFTEDTRAHDVQGMFTRIASRYDVMNRLMTAGQDVRWRRDVIRLARPGPGHRLLDLGAGTGDLAREALRQQPACDVLAADFTIEMMRIGRNKPPSTAPLRGSAQDARREAEGRRTDRAPVMEWSAADALRLPFPDAAFDAFVSGFLLRNVVDLRQALREQHRVLKPNGRWVSLDTTRPRRNRLYPFIRFHLHHVIPTLGRLLTGQPDAYTYLPDSTESFLSAEDLAARLRETGFREVEFSLRMFGTIAIHAAGK